MLSDFGFANGGFVPFHLDKIQSSLQLDHTVNLLDDPLSTFSHKVEGLTN